MNNKFMVIQNGWLEGKVEGHNNHGHVALIHFWEQQTQMLERIKKAGGFTPYVAQLLGLANAFQADSHLRCIDEGTPNGSHAAGSGVAYVKTAGFDNSLGGYAAIEAGIKAASEAFKDAGLDGIFSHEECGAAKLVYDLFPIEFKSQLERDHGIKSADEFGNYFARKLAEKMGKKYNRHIGIGEMARPSGAHVTRITYVDATGRFNPAEIKGLQGLPAGFVISRSYLGAEQTAVEVDVSVAIATGNHGFGNRITSAQPHVLVAVGNPNDSTLSAQALMRELQQIAAKYNGKVIVDGFEAPINYKR